jgi:hypothetical protein
LLKISPLENFKNLQSRAVFSHRKYQWSSTLSKIMKIINNTWNNSVHDVQYLSSRFHVCWRYYDSQIYAKCVNSHRRQALNIPGNGPLFPGTAIPTLLIPTDVGIWSSNEFSSTCVFWRMQLSISTVRCISLSFSCLSFNYPAVLVFVQRTETIIGFKLLYESDILMILYYWN